METDNFQLSDQEYCSEAQASGRHLVQMARNAISCTRLIGNFRIKKIEEKNLTGG